MNILLMMLRAAPPSRLDDMKAVAMPRWIKRGYEGLTFFGHIITHSQQEAEAFNACHTLTDRSLSGTRLPRFVVPVLSALRLVLADGLPLLPPAEECRLPAEPLRTGSLHFHARPPLSRQQA